MRIQAARRLAIALGIAAIGAGVVVSAQGMMLPSSPKKAFGASISPAYDGWYTNADGTHTFLIGYYNRNWKAEVDVPIGPENHFEPGPPDRGQPTHFMPNRGFGMFTVTVPKDTPANDRLWWVLTVNGVTQRVPFHRSPDYNISPNQASEESPGGKYNRPPILRFSENGPAIQNPIASLETALARSATVGKPLTLDLWVEDDGLYSSGSNAPITEDFHMANVVISRYRGPGPVTVVKDEKWTTLKGGKPGEPYAGKISASVTFSQAGDYMLHLTVNDLSGPGGGATGCCWTTALIKVDVKGTAVPTGQE